MIGGCRDESWLLEKPMQCSVALPRTIGLPANCIYGYLVKRSQTYTWLANLTMSSFQCSSFLGHPVKSNLDRTDKLEDVIPCSVSNIIFAIEGWPLRLRKCPASDWKHLNVVFGQPCLHCCSQPSHYFGDEKLCLCIYCMTDFIFQTQAVPGIFERCRVCYAVIGIKGDLSCGDPMCALYLLCLYRITEAW